MVTLKLTTSQTAPSRKLAMLGLVSRKIEGDLERFRQFIRERRTETGGWRGEIRGREVKSSETNAKGANMQEAAPKYDNSGKSGL